MTDSWLDDEKLRRRFTPTSEDRKTSTFKRGLARFKKLNLDIPKIDTTFDAKAAFNPNIPANIPNFKESIKLGEAMQGQGTGAIGKAVISAAISELFQPKPTQVQPGTNTNVGAGGEVALRQSMPEEEHWLGPIYS